MLHFLNGRKQSRFTQRNFARDFREIYTPGEGNGYSERDVKKLRVVLPAGNMTIPERFTCVKNNLIRA